MINVPILLVNCVVAMNLLCGNSLVKCVNNSSIVDVVSMYRVNCYCGNLFTVSFWYTRSVKPENFVLEVYRMWVNSDFLLVIFVMCLNNSKDDVDVNMCSMFCLIVSCDIIVINLIFIKFLLFIIIKYDVSNKSFLVF